MTAPELELEEEVDGQLDMLAAIAAAEVKLRADARPTSAAAAAKASLRAGSARARVLGQLVDGGAATDEELQRSLAMSPNTQRPRRLELVEAGLVSPVDGLTRPTSSGSQAVVWQATELGRDALARARRPA